MSYHVEVGPDIKVSTHHIALTDGKQWLGLIVCDSKGAADPYNISASPNMRSALRTKTGTTKYEDLEEPWSATAQEDWSGGRALEDYEDDTTRFFDSRRCQTAFKQIYNAPLDYYATGIKQAKTNWPGSVMWKMVKEGEGYAYQITLTESMKVGQLYILLRRRGNPGSYLRVALCANSESGTPGTELAAHLFTLDEITDVLSEWKRFKFTEQTLAAGIYWVKVLTRESSHTDYWEIGFKDKSETFRTFILSNGKWQPTRTYDMYYRIAAADSGRKTRFFTYKRLTFALTQTASGSPKLYINGDIGMADSNAGHLAQVIDATKHWATNQWAGCRVGIIAGQGIQESVSIWRTVVSNDATHLILDKPWINTQNTSTTYIIADTEKFTEIPAATHGLTAYVTDIAVTNDIIYFAQGDAVPMRKMKWVNGSWLSMADEYVHAMKPAKDPDAEEEPEPQDVTVRNCATYLKTVRDTTGLVLWRGQNNDDNHQISISQTAVTDWLTQNITLCDLVGEIPPTGEADSEIEAAIAALREQGQTADFYGIYTYLQAQGSSVTVEQIVDYLLRHHNGSSSTNTNSSTSSTTSGSSSAVQSDTAGTSTADAEIAAAIAALQQQGETADFGGIYAYLQAQGSSVTAEQIAAYLLGAGSGTGNGNSQTGTGTVTAAERKISDAIAAMIAAGTEVDAVSLWTYLQSHEPTVTAEDLASYIQAHGLNVLPDDEGGDGDDDEDEEEVPVLINSDNEEVYSDGVDFGKPDDVAVMYKVTVGKITGEDHPMFRVMLQSSEDNIVYEDVKWVDVDTSDSVLYFAVTTKKRWRRLHVSILAGTSPTLSSIKVETVNHSKFIGTHTFNDSYGKITDLAEYPMMMNTVYQTLWINREGMIHSISSEGTVDTINLEELSTAMEEWNGSTSMEHNAYYYVRWMKSGIQRYYNMQLDSMGPDRDAGLPEDRQGAVVDMLAYPGRYFAVIDAGEKGYSSVLLNNNSGWHEIYRAPNVGERIYSLGYQAISGDRPDRLWMSVGDDVMWLVMPSNTLKAYQDKAAEYTHESVMVSSWMSIGMVDVMKQWGSMNVMAENLSTEGVYIEADYQIDQDPEWYPMSDFYTETPTQEIWFDEAFGVSAKRLRYRLRLQTNDKMKTPIVKAVVMKTVIKVSTKYNYSFPCRNVENDVNLRGEVETLRPYERHRLLTEWANDAVALRMYSFTPMMNDRRVFLDPPSFSNLREKTRPGYIVQINMNEI